MFRNITIPPITYEEFEKREKQYRLMKMGLGKIKRILHRRAINQKIKQLDTQRKALRWEDCHPVSGVTDVELDERMLSDIEQLKKERDALRTTATT